MDFKKLIELVNRYEASEYEELKDKQKEALTAAKDGDVICLLPTGYGKSVIIHMLPFLDLECEPKSCLVIAPLNAIMHEHSRRFKDGGTIILDEAMLRDISQDQSLETLDSDVTTLERIKGGDFRFIVGHPEQLCHDLMKKLFIDPCIASKISHIVVDEAHVILSWGKSAFRPAYMKLGSLRTILPNAHVVALTATATPKALTEIKKALHMRNCDIVTASPDRPSVYFEVRKRAQHAGKPEPTVEEGYRACLQPYLKELAHLGEAFPRTIVYLNQLRWCGEVHGWAIACLKNTGYTKEEADKLVAQYHAPQSKTMKTIIANEMKEKKSPLRLLIATEAYGMGADSPNIRRIIHVGTPSNLETFIQEVGRGGRDDEPTISTLYYTNSDIAKNRQSLTKEMREYCQLTTKCRRKFLIEYFGFTIEQNDPKRCCDICAGVETDAQVSDTSKAKSKVNEGIVYCLLQYFEAVNKPHTNVLVPEAATGLSSELAENISKQPERFVKDKELQEEFPFLGEDHILNIQAILEMTEHLWIID